MATPPSSSPYPPQQPAPRPWRRALGDWWRTQPGHYQLGCLLGGGIVVLTTLAVVIAGTAGFIQALTASSTGVTPSVTASSPSSTSPSPVVAPPSTAVLGGPYATFQAQYAPDQNGAITLDGYTLYLAPDPASATHGTITPVDGVDRVWNIGVTYTGPMPGAGALLTQARRFFPPDARLASATSEGQSKGHLYQSAALASAFDPGSFVDGAGHLLAPGSFSYTPLSGGWVIEVGEG